MVQRPMLKLIMNFLTMTSPLKDHNTTCHLIIVWRVYEGDCNGLVKYSMSILFLLIPNQES